MIINCLSELFEERDQEVNSGRRTVWIAGTHTLELFARHKAPDAGKQLDSSMFKGKKLLFPCHTDGNHWTLVVVDLELKRFEYYDSLKGRSGKPIVQKVKAYLKAVRALPKFATSNEAAPTSFDDWPLVSPTVPQQTNGDDCGCFCICFMDQVSAHRAVTEGLPEDSTDYRLKLLSFLLAKKTEQRK